MPASVLRFCLFFGLVFGIAAWSASPYVLDDADVSEDPNVQGDADVSEDPDVQDDANPNTSDVVDADGCGDAAPCEDGTYCIDEEECIADGQQCTSAEIRSLDTFEGDATMVPGGARARATEAAVLVSPTACSKTSG